MTFLMASTHFSPLFLVFFVQKIIGSWLVAREDQAERIQNSARVKVLFWFILNKDSNQVMHALVLLFRLVLVHVKFFTEEAVPILFEFGLSCFSDHFSLKLDTVLVFTRHEVIESRACCTLEEGGGRHDYITVVALFRSTGVRINLDSLLDTVGKSDGSCCIDVIFA